MDRHCEALLAQIEDFLAETGMSESTFGLRSVNDNKLLERIRTRGSVTTKTVQKIERFIASRREERAA